MEFNSDEYKRCIGKVLTSIDSHKYVQSKIKEKYTYLKCAIFRSGCKETGKIDFLRNLIIPMRVHTHVVEDYKADTFKPKPSAKWLLNK